MSNEQIIQICDKYVGLRLDKVLSLKIQNYSRTYLTKLIKTGMVSINNVIISKPDFIIKNPTTTIKVVLKDDDIMYYTSLKSEDFNYDIMYEDNDLIVINKPPKVVVHPAPGNFDNTIVNAMIGKDKEFIHKFKDDVDSFRPGIVHRLDKDTSGALIIAKNPISKYKLCKQFANGIIKKEYTAIVCGISQEGSKTITTLIGRHPINRKKMAVVEKNGKIATTIYQLIQTGKIENINVSVLSIKILTGRTHQIRVHLAHNKIPVLGDKIYGGHQKNIAERHMLHANKLTFYHPITNEIISINCPLFEDQQILLDIINNNISCV